MRRIPGYQLAAAALMTVAVLLSVACVQRLAHVPDFGRVASSARVDVVPKVVQGPPGSLQVAVPFPALAKNRRPQYAYDSGFVYSVELHLYDSQGNYQNYLVVRNTELAAGLAAGTASVTFTNVPPGPCTLSVHTSQKQLYGAAGSSAVIKPRISAGNTSFEVTGVVADVNSRFSDTSSPFLVFRSNDINNGAGANGAPTSALFTQQYFQARNGLEKEHLDTTTVTAGYGTGAATATITPAATITINVTVTQPPAWSTTMYQTSPIEMATVSAGATLSAVPSATALVSGPSNTVPVDRIVIASSSFAATLTNGDLVDLKDLPDKGAIATISAGIIQIPSDLQAGSYSLYPLRGSLVSRIGEIGGKLPPKLVVLPGAISSSRSFFTITATSLAAGAAATISVNLRDRIGNPVTNLDGVTAGLNDGATISNAVVIPIQVATASTYLVSAKTYGSLPAFPRSSSTGNYAVAYTQGSIAASANGTAGAATVAGGSGRTQAPGFTAFFYPARLGTLAVNDTITMAATDSPVNPVVSLGFNNTTFASRNQPAASTRVSIPVTVDAAQGGAFGVCELQTNNTAYTTADNGTTLQVTSFGTRRIGDRDRMDITVQSSASAQAATHSITIIWAQ